MRRASSQCGWLRRRATGQIERTNEQVDRLIELQEKEHVSFPKSRSKWRGRNEEDR